MWGQVKFCYPLQPPMREGPADLGSREQRKGAFLEDVEERPKRTRGDVTDTSPGGCLGPRLSRQPPSTLSQMSRQAPRAWLESLPDLMARMQPNCVWTDSILRCVCTATLLNSICDVKPQLIMEKQIRFNKLNFLLPFPVRRLPTAFAQRGVLPTCSVTHPFEPNPSDPPGSTKVPPAWPPQPLQGCQGDP